MECVTKPNPDLEKHSSPCHCRSLLSISVAPVHKEFMG